METIEIDPPVAPVPSEIEQEEGAPGGGTVKATKQEPSPPVTEAGGEPSPPVTETGGEPVPPVTKTGSEPVPPATEAGGEPSAFRFFSSTSFWNQSLPTDAPLDAESGSLVAQLQELVNTEISGKWGPWISTTGFSTPIYTVPADQPAMYVHEENAKPSPSLQSAFSAVPLPADAKPATGTDEQLTVWQPSTDKLWEFWGMTDREGTWYARWGGAIEDVSQSPGYFTPAAWPGAQTNWGATATSLPLVGGLITLQNLEEGKIEHALAMSLPSIRKGIWSWPAQRSDGTSTSPEAIPEGTRFRLDPSLDIASLNLPPLVRMMATAAQRYGIVVRDKSGVVNFYGQDPTPTGTNPWTSEFGKSFIWQLLAKFPWSHLEALKLTRCPGSTCLTG